MDERKVWRVWIEEVDAGSGGAPLREIASNAPGFAAAALASEWLEQRVVERDYRGQLVIGGDGAEEIAGHVEATLARWSSLRGGRPMVRISIARVTLERVRRRFRTDAYRVRETGAVLFPPPREWKMPRGTAAVLGGITAIVFAASWSVTADLIGGWPAFFTYLAVAAGVVASCACGAMGGPSVLRAFESREFLTRSDAWVTKVDR
jgi:hypothetical protein